MTTLGIDIGCISLKAALVGRTDDQDLFRDLLSQHPGLFQAPRDGLTVVGGAPVLVVQYRRIKGSPAQAAEALLGELLAVLPEGSVHGARVTGSGGRLVGPALDAAFENEFKAITRGISALYPETQTIFEMGGETSKFIRLEASDVGCAGIVDYQTNGDCAAGTGSFIDQQASRLQYDIEDVGDIVLGAAKRGQIAGRCSVFAKSDMIHAQQKGYEPPEVLRGLCDAVMRNFKGTIAKGKVIEPPVAFIGGVAANDGVVRSLREAFDLDDGQLFVPEYHASMGAIGAALIEADLEAARDAARPGARRRAPPAAEFPLAEPPLDGARRAAARQGQAVRVRRRRVGASTPTWASTSAPSPPTSSSSTTTGDVIKEIYTDRRAPGRGREQGTQPTSRARSAPASTCSASAPPAPGAS